MQSTISPIDEGILAKDPSSDPLTSVDTTPPSGGVDMEPIDPTALALVPFEDKEK